MNTVIIKRRLIIIVLLFITVITVDYGFAEIIDDISVTMEPTEGFGQSTHGYLEYRFELENLSSDKEHFVSLAYPKSTYNKGDTIRQIKKAVMLRPGDKVTVSLFQPPLRIEGSSEVDIEIDGRSPRMDNSIILPHQSHGIDISYGRDSKACVLLARDVPGDFNQAIERAFPRNDDNNAKASGGFSISRISPRPGISHIVGLPGGPPDILDTFEAKRSESNIDRWSGNWLGYSRYDCIVLTGREMTLAPGHVKAALLRYVECGGTMVVTGQWQAPQEWESKKQTGSEVTTYYAGFGECLSIPQSDVNNWSVELWGNIRDSWLRTWQTWQSIKSVEDANKAFSVVDNLSIPARGLFVLILVFALLIGPLNILFYSNKRRRMRLLWTVPLLSVITSAAVFAYSLFSEGITGQVRLECLTVLNENSHRATTLGWLGYYCPLTPGGGLHFDTQSELTPQIAQHYWYDGGRSRDVDWTNDQHLGSGWLAARIPAHFMLRKTETRRERLTVRHDQQGNVSVVNSLGADIEKLWLADEDGTIHTAKNIPAGDTKNLNPGPKADADPNVLRKVYSSDWLGTINKLSADTKNDAESFLQPGCYIAVLGDVPFMEKGLNKANIKKSKTIVYGIME